MRIALDTNVLAYAEGVNGADRKRSAMELVRQLPQGAVLLPVQALGELFQLLVRKAGVAPTKARAAILNWGDTFPMIETTPQVLFSAMDLTVDHRFTIWDALIVSATAEAGCRLLLSEDLQEGFTWKGVTVTNPFAATKHALLADLLGTRGTL